MMKALTQQELYTSPEVEVIETQMQAMICQSNTTTSIDDMPENDMDIVF